VYLPSRPLHMLPPSLMDSVSFNDQMCGEAVTVEVVFDVQAGAVRETHVCASVVSPAAKMDFTWLNIQLAEGGSERWQLFLRCAQIGSEHLESVVGKRPRRSPGEIAHVKTKGGNVRVLPFTETEGHQLMDTFLRLASHAFRQFAAHHGVALPERKGAQSFALRCGTAPLRRYTDLLVQRQLKRIISGGQPISNSKVWKLGLELEKKHHTARSEIANQRKNLLFDQLSGQLRRRSEVLGRILERVEGESREWGHLNSYIQYPTIQAEVKWIGRKKIGIIVEGLGLEMSVPKPTEFCSPVGAKLELHVTSVDLNRQTIAGEILNPPYITASTTSATSTVEDNHHDNPMGTSWTPSPSFPIREGKEAPSAP